MAANVSVQPPQRLKNAVAGLTGDLDENTYSRFAAISDHITSKSADENNFSRSGVSALSLSKLTSELLRFMDENFGLSAKQTDRTIAKIPIKCFKDYSPDGSLVTILTTVLRHNGGIAGIDLSNVERREEYRNMFVSLEQTLKRRNFLPSIRLASASGVPSNVVEEIAKRRRYALTTMDKATHILYPDPHGTTVEETEGIEYCKTILVRNTQALVHWWYNPDSYDSWIPAAEVDGLAEEEEDGHSGAWHLQLRWLQDTDRFNELMNESDYKINEKDRSPAPATLQEQRALRKASTVDSPSIATLPTPPLKRASADDGQRSSGSLTKRLWDGTNAAKGDAMLSSPSSALLQSDDSEQRDRKRRKAGESNGGGRQRQDSRYSPETARIFEQDSEEAEEGEVDSPSDSGTADGEDEEKVDEESRGGKAAEHAAKRKPSGRQVSSGDEDSPNEQQNELQTPTGSPKASKMASASTTGSIGHSATDAVLPSRVPPQERHTTASPLPPKSPRRIQELPLPPATTHPLVAVVDQPSQMPREADVIRIRNACATAQLLNERHPRVNSASSKLEADKLRRVSQVSSASWFSTEKLHNIERRALTTYAAAGFKLPEEMYRSIRDRLVAQWEANGFQYVSVVDAVTSANDLSADVTSVLIVLRLLEHWNVVNHHGCASKRQELPPLMDQKSSDLLRTFLPQGGSRLLICARNEKRCQHCDADVRRLAMVCSAGTAEIVICSRCYANGRFSGLLSARDFRAAHNDDGGEPWQAEEDAMLLEGVEQFPDDWDRISEHVGSRDARACLFRFLWLPMEDIVLERARERRGNFDSAATEAKMFADMSASETPFSRVKNPLMAQTAFLAANLSPDVAAATARETLTIQMRRLAERREGGAKGVESGGLNELDELCRAALKASRERANHLARVERREAERFEAMAVEMRIHELELKVRRLAELDRYLQSQCGSATTAVGSKPLPATSNVTKAEPTALAAPKPLGGPK